MYICLLLLNEIVYQIQGLYLHYGTQVCFHVAYKIHGLWAAQSSEMLLFPLPEGYPNIEAVNGSPRKEVCDMKFKIIVFKFVVSRLGFYHACQTFASFFFFFPPVGLLYKCGFHLCIHRRKWWFSHFVGNASRFLLRPQNAEHREVEWVLGQEEGDGAHSRAVLGKGSPGLVYSLCWSLIMMPSFPGQPLLFSSCLYPAPSCGLCTAKLQSPPPS